MIYLALSVLFSSLLYIIFKYFDRFKIDTLQAIVVNYLVAGTLGFILSKDTINWSQIISANWLPVALLMGCLFIFIFNIMALTSQRNGVAVASVSGKMSMVIPVIAGIIWFQETSGWLKIVGICFALIAVYLTVSKKGKTGLKKDSSVIYPVLLFLGSGLIDTVMKFIERNYITDTNESLISGCIFYAAFSIGIFIIIYQYFIDRKNILLKNIIAGIILGIPNYYSIIFLFKTLNTVGFEASFIYPINHVGTVLLSTGMAILIFKERLELKNWLGIILAVVAISVIAFAKASFQ